MGMRIDPPISNLNQLANQNIICLLGAHIKALTISVATLQYQN